MYPESENVPQKIFGGYLIRRAYENAAMCAEEVGRDRPVIVAVNRINFLQPVRGATSCALSAARRSQECSVAVETDIIRISRDRGESALSNSCIFTFVNVDEAGLTPRPVVPVYPTTYAEDARWLAGHRRREAHLAWKAGGRRKS